MTRNSVVVAVMFGCLSLLAACSQEQPKSPAKDQPVSQPVKQSSPQVLDDLAKYSASVSQAMKPWATIDKMTDDLAKEKSAKSYVAKLRKEFVPLVSGVVKQMEAVKPVTPEVQSIHTAYLASIKDYLAGLQGMAAAVEKNDDAQVGAAAAKLNAFTAAHAKFLADTAALNGQPAAPAK